MGARETYETLNGIRGVAAICVVVFHMHGSFWPEQALSGYLAVDIFFVLSGFVLADAYGSKLVDGSISTSRFALMRLTRFYPLYTAGLILGVAKVLAQQGVGSENALSVGNVPSAFVSALLFLPAIGSGLTNIAPLNVPAWSLLYEFWVNVFWAAIIPRFDVKIKIATILISAVVFAKFTMEGGNANLGPSWEGLIGGVARTVFSFTMGLALYQIRPAVRSKGTALPLLALFIAFVLLFLEPSKYQRVYYDLAVAIILSPLLVFAASRIEPSKRILPLFVWLGTISFPLYAIHAPLIAMGIFVVRKASMSVEVGGAILLVVLLISASVASIIDRKAQFRIRRLFVPRKGLSEIIRR